MATYFARYAAGLLPPLCVRTLMSTFPPVVRCHWAAPLDHFHQRGSHATTCKCACPCRARPGVTSTTSAKSKPQPPFGLEPPHRFAPRAAALDHHARHFAHARIIKSRSAAGSPVSRTVNVRRCGTRCRALFRASACRAASRNRRASLARRLSSHLRQSGWRHRMPVSCSCPFGSRRTNRPSPQRAIRSIMGNPSPCALAKCQGVPAAA